MRVHKNDTSLPPCSHVQRKIITFHAVCVLQWAFISAGPVLVLPSVSTHLHGLKGGHVDAHLVVLVPGIAMLARRSWACPARCLIHLRVQLGQTAARDVAEHDHAPRRSAARPHQRILGHCAEGWLSLIFTSQQEASLRPFLHVLVTEKKRWTTIDLVVDGPRCTLVVIVDRGLVHSSWRGKGGGGMERGRPAIPAVSTKE